jgi:hypothetical protein
MDKHFHFYSLLKRTAYFLPHQKLWTITRAWTNDFGGSRATSGFLLLTSTSGNRKGRLRHKCVRIDFKTPAKYHDCIGGRILAFRSSGLHVIIVEGEGELTIAV